MNFNFVFMYCTFYSIKHCIYLEIIYLIFFFKFQVRVQRMTYARYSTYGELYTAMATTTGEIPIAIYRTEENVDSTTASQNVSTG